MPRRPITKEHAEIIAGKIGAVKDESGKAHDRAEFYYGGVLVLSFGIRRSSRKDIGHDFIPADLHLSHHQTLELARCNISLEEYVEILIEKGFIVVEEEDTPN